VRVTTLAPDVPASTPDVGSRRAPVPRSPARREPRLRTRGGRFSCQPRMDPRSAALRDNKRGSRETRTPENATCKCRRRPALARRRPSGALTDPPPPASTTVSRWPSWPCSLRSQRRRSRYLPFKPRTRSGAAVAREAAAPRPHSQCFACSHASVDRWALPEARQARQNSRPAPDAAHRSRPPLSTRPTQHAVVFASMRLPARPRS
jgi:hypothetical protein